MRTFKIKDSDVIITIDSKSDLTNKQIRSYLMQLVKVDELKDENEFIVPKEVFIFDLSKCNYSRNLVTYDERGQLMVGNIRMEKSHLQKYLNQAKDSMIEHHSYYDESGHHWVTRIRILMADTLDKLKDNVIKFMFNEDRKS